MISKTRIAVAAAVAFVIGAPALAHDEEHSRGEGRLYDRHYDQDGRHRDEPSEHSKRDDWDDKHRGRGHRFNIPAGHYPPPGECRIWHPDRPPGHQPPPGDCGKLRYRIPRGAFLIRG